MSNDISTPLTKQRNKAEGRHGWVEWKADKDRKINPRDYGEFISKKRRKKKWLTILIYI